MKQTRVEPLACNSEVNKKKRKDSTEALIDHHAERNLVVYFDQTKLNLYTKRIRGRAKKGKCAIDVLPASKGPSPRIHCVVPPAIGAVKYCTKKGKCAIDVLPASKGPSPRIHCVVPPAIGAVKYRTQRGGIKMHDSAVFVDEIYDAMKVTGVYKEWYADKKIVVVFDNAPAPQSDGGAGTKEQ
ncbi:hypothetical protein PF011_g2476 [Phytophthora fragariae]|uniref:Tc1-like transposase DDE domain-containing protein n=2 Tax=Phytophthora fragariae TaxID=53985 RepID=A0A6A3M8B9_9STRA|nr:hypothetical protein PF011_g2476 [Phytophthora fragariae]